MENEKLKIEEAKSAQYHSILNELRILPRNKINVEGKAKKYFFMCTQDDRKNCNWDLFSAFDVYVYLVHFSL